MQMLRITLLAISLIGLTGWVSLRKRHSPVDDLPAIANTAFQIHAPTPQAGLALAEAARGWRGVTAATYNPASDLLVVRQPAHRKKRFRYAGRAQMPGSHGCADGFTRHFFGRRGQRPGHATAVDLLAAANRTGRLNPFKFTFFQQKLFLTSWFISFVS